MNAQDALYGPIILRHARAPTGRGLPSSADLRAACDNPLCGDRIEVGAALEAGRLRELGFEARGCALTLASASMMVTALRGAALAEAAALGDALHALIAGGVEPWPAELGELAAFAPVVRHPSRTQCVWLPWQALRQALDARPQAAG